MIALMNTFDHLYQSCPLCPRQCGADRTKGATGICQAPAKPKVARIMLHQWEEPCISGSRGSGTVFFSHCNLQCVYCQNYLISQEGRGREITSVALAEMFINLQNQGAHNLNLVSPTPYLPSIVDALTIAKKDGLSIPVIYNTNGYELPAMLEHLNGLIDIYLPDLKYYSNTVSARLSGINDYFKRATAAILAMFNQVGVPQFDKDDLITRGLIIRHLILPNHLAESKRILDWIRVNLPPTIYLSLMAQYYPAYQAARHPEINRLLTHTEYDEIVDYCWDLGLKNGFIQEISAADPRYTPKFDQD
jgi:putative pyruvate formate lyase activating enzyme